MGCHSCGARARTGARFCGVCGTTLGSAGPGLRKTVTVLFADAPPVTAPDLESGVRLAAAFHDRLRRVLEQHGGTVERHAGDAVMAVFGVPSARDDDARRAAAAGLALQSLPSGGPRLAVGINTGEVFTGNGSADQELAVGDAVVVAARLQQLADPGEVLLGPATVRLLGPGARLGPSRDVTLRGRVGLLPVVPLWGLEAPAPASPRGPFVGREAERRLLIAALDRTLTTGLAQLVWLLGEAGTGKSRLVREVLREQSSAVTTLSGTCRGYGDRPAWSALIEVLHDAAGVALDATAETVLASLVSTRPELEPVLPTLGCLLGGRELPVGGADLAWAVVRVLTTIAKDRPLVVVLEDVHLAGEPLLDLLHTVVRRVEGAPVVVITTGRPELLELRPDWGRGVRHVVGLSLRPLPEEEARQLAHQLIPDNPDGAERLLFSAGGNPLFLAQLAQAWAEGIGDGAPSVSAVLTARLDRLPRETRQVLERAAIVGSRGLIADLEPLWDSSPDLERELEELARRDLLEMQDNCWVFASELVRDSASAGLTRQGRADIHALRGLVLVADGASAGAGFHLEQASRLLRRSDPDRSAGLAEQAASQLAAAGVRALTGDLTAAADLLDRASGLMAPDELRRLVLLPDLARALLLSGDLARAGQVLDEALVRADALGLHQAGAHARLAKVDLLRMTEPERAYTELTSLVDEVIPALEQTHDDRGLALAYQLQASELQYRVQWAAMQVPLGKALEHAHRAGDRRLTELAESLQVGSMFHGPMPLDETRSHLEEMLQRRDISPSHRASVEARLAGTLALQGDPDAGRALMVTVKQAFRDLGRELSSLATAFMSGPVEMLAGHPDRAAVELRAACDGLMAMGDRAFSSTLAALLAEACWRCEDPDGAAGAVALSRSTAADSDVISQVRWRSVQAKLDALEGRAEQALQLSAEAVRLVATTDELISQGDVLADAAEVHELVGGTGAGQPLLREAVQRYQRKGAPQAIRQLATGLYVSASTPLQPQPAPATPAALDRDA